VFQKNVVVEPVAAVGQQSFHGCLEGKKKGQGIEKGAKPRKRPQIKQARRFGTEIDECAVQVEEQRVDGSGRQTGQVFHFHLFCFRTGRGPCGSRLFPEKAP